MRLVKLSFKPMWAGRLSTTSAINNLLPGCLVDKLNSFHHLLHPHLLPSQTHATSPRSSKLISEMLRRGRETGEMWGRREEKGISVFT